MKIFILGSLLFAAAGAMQASIIETISFDLSHLHAGSTLSGTFDLSDSPQAGDTASVSLSFSDPTDYSSTPLTATLTIENGTPSGYTVDFSELTFTNLGGTSSPIDSKDVDLTRSVFAHCASFPCTASGQFADRSPSVFTASYSISPVPEPGYFLLVPVLLSAIVFGRRLVRRPSGIRVS